MNKPSLITRRSAHLSLDRWVSFISPDNGPTYMRLKRVSSAMNAQFPLELRRIYRRQGLNALVKHIMVEDHISLSEAWRKIRRMFND